MDIRLPIALVVATFIAGCAGQPEPKSAPPPPPPPPDVVVLLPHADGTTGAVVMKQGTREVILDSSYASARSGGDGVPTKGRESESTVKKEFGAALAALPPAPASFLLYFRSGSDEFTDESKANVQLLLDEMRRRPAPEIAVVGHTDRVGTDQANDVLSLQRAQRVRDMLMQLGVAAERIRVAGRGEREPLVPTEDGVAEPRNRRVEVSVR